MKDADQTASARRRARDMFRRAYRAQMSGDLEQAMNLYRSSIEVHPTSEAHTFLGWAHSFRREYDEAMNCCRAAIEIDPDFGNPYNDIGAYLIELGRWDEARPWLRASLRARRYRSYHFPHFNLGRIHERRLEFEAAELEYRQALRFQPRYEPARLALRRLLQRRN